MENDICQRLLAIAETKADANVAPFGSRGDALLEAIGNLQARSTYRDSWVSCLDDEIADCWDDLPPEAQLSAFIVAASFSSSLDGPADFELGP